MKLAHKFLVIVEIIEELFGKLLYLE